MPAAPDCALEEAMVTMRPQPASIMSGTTGWIELNVLIASDFGVHPMTLSMRLGLLEHKKAVLRRAAAYLSQADLPPR